MWRKIGRRDWHTLSDASALPQAKSDIQSQEINSTHGVILGPVPGLSVGTSRGLSIDPLETRNQESRVKHENDSVVVAPPEQPLPVIPGEGAQRRRPGTQEPHVQTPSHATTGFRLALSHVRNDTVGVSKNLA
jgi:hypothetical protein